MRAAENRSYWQEKIKLQCTSQLSKADFCRENQIDYNKFNYWFKRLSKNTEILIPIKIKSEDKAVSGELRVLCSLTLNNGQCLRIHDPEALVLILQRIGKQ